MEKSTPPSSGFGIAIFVEAKPLRYASSAVSARPSASPVDFISGPRLTSTSGSFSKLNTGILTATVGAGG